MLGQNNMLNVDSCTIWWQNDVSNHTDEVVDLHLNWNVEHVRSDADVPSLDDSHVPSDPPVDDPHAVEVDTYER